MPYNRIAWTDIYIFVMVVALKAVFTVLQGSLSV